MTENFELPEWIVEFLDHDIDQLNNIINANYNDLETKFKATIRLSQTNLIRKCLISKSKGEYK